MTTAIVDPAEYHVEELAFDPAFCGTLTDWIDYDQEHPARPAPIPGLTDPDFTMLVGDGGAGKTRFLLQMLVSIVTGQPFGPFVPSPGIDAVTYMGTDAGARRNARRKLEQLVGPEHASRIHLMVAPRDPIDRAYWYRAERRLRASRCGIFVLDHMTLQLAGEMNIKDTSAVGPILQQMIHFSSFVPTVVTAHVRAGNTSLEAEAFGSHLSQLTQRGKIVIVGKDDQVRDVRVTGHDSSPANFQMRIWPKVEILGDLVSDEKFGPARSERRRPRTPRVDKPKTPGVRETRAAVLREAGASTMQEAIDAIMVAEPNAERGTIRRYVTEHAASFGLS